MSRYRWVQWSLSKSDEFSKQPFLKSRMIWKIPIFWGPCKFICLHYGRSNNSWAFFVETFLFIINLLLRVTWRGRTPVSSSPCTTWVATRSDSKDWKNCCQKSWFLELQCQWIDVSTTQPNISNALKTNSGVDGWVYSATSNGSHYQQVKITINYLWMDAAPQHTQKL